MFFNQMNDDTSQVAAFNSPRRNIQRYSPVPRNSITDGHCPVATSVENEGCKSEKFRETNSQPPKSTGPGRKGGVTVVPESRALH